MVETKLFDGEEKKLIVYNRQAVVNKQFYFFTESECEPDPVIKIDFDFPGFVSGFFRVFNERLGTQIKDITMDNNGPYLFLNASVEDMTFEDNGYYYYEIGYDNGYEIVLRYGTLIVL